MIRGRQPVITGGTEVTLITHSVKIVIAERWLHVYKVENVEVLLPCWSSNNAFCSPTCSAQRGASRILPTGTKIIIHLWNIPWILLNFFSCDLLINRAVELANSLETSDPVSIPQLEHSSEFLHEFSTYWMGKSLFDLREYRRAAHSLGQCKSSEAFFLRCYSLYLVNGAVDVWQYQRIK